MSLVPKSIDFEACWNADCNGPLQALFRARDEKTEIEAAPVFNTIYHLAVASPVDHLLTVYERVGRIFVEAIIRLRQEIVEEHRRGTNFLDVYSQAWRRYYIAVNRTDALCMYVNKVIEKLRDDNLPRKTMIILLNGERCEVRVRNIRAMGLGLWRTGILECLKIEMDNILVKSILKGIDELRLGGPASEASLVPLELSIKSFDHSDPKDFLGPYPVEFREEDEDEEKLMAMPKTFYDIEIETPFLEVTKQFYRRESKIKISHEDITEYVRYAEMKLRQEIQVAKKLFPITSSPKIISTVETELILQHTKKLQSDFNDLLEKQVENDLEIVYRLLKRIPDGIEPLSKCYEDFVVKEGRKKLEGVNRHFGSDGQLLLHHQHRISNGISKICGLFVTILGPLLRSFKLQVKKSFDNDHRFEECLDNAFRKIMSFDIPHSKIDPGLLLAEFFDLLYRNELVDKKELVQDVFNSLLGDGLALTSYFTDKDSFTAAYINRLAARLIYKLSHHGNAELGTIRSLREICGHEAQVRMNKMVQDISISYQLKEQFEMYLLERSFSLPCEVMTIVPTYVVWPLVACDPMDPSNHLPPVLTQITQKYTSFYRRTFPNRHLNWLNHLSRVILTHTGVDGRVYELYCTVPQANVLLKYQFIDVYQVKDLLDSLSLDQFGLLIDPIVKLGLLYSDNPSGILNEDTILRINLNWKGSKTRITFAHYSLLHSIERDASIASPADSHPMLIGTIKTDIVDGSLNENRKYLLQCIIVRLLKFHQQLSPVRLAQLVTEAAKHQGPLSFEPPQTHLKIVLEQLEDKQYLEYDAKRDLFVYIP